MPKAKQNPTNKPKKGSAEILITLLTTWMRRFTSIAKENSELKFLAYVFIAQILNALENDPPLALEKLAELPFRLDEKRLNKTEAKNILPSNDQLHNLLTFREEIEKLPTQYEWTDGEKMALEWLARLIISGEELGYCFAVHSTVKQAEAQKTEASNYALKSVNHQPAVGCAV